MTESQILLKPLPRSGEKIDRLRTALRKALRGKEDVIDRILTGLLARGHLLLEDRPGLGKTTIAKALATAIGGRFARVQCTPDLLPSDITGFSIFNPKTREFDFQPGPVFSDVLLADEINRATPRTQSALLEAMAERQVTVDNVRYRLSPTFFVIATQNPLEHHGTYPLPEAQLDRFAMKLSIGYPSREDELGLLSATVGPVEEQPGESAVLDEGDLAELQRQVAAVAVHPKVQGYLVDLAWATRQHPQVAMGVSPRGLLIWQRVAQAWAFLQHRSFVTPDDVQALGPPVLSVRLGVEGESEPRVIEQIIASVAVPT